MTLNPDPLHVPEADPPRRPGCLSVLPWLALLLAIALGIAPGRALPSIATGSQPSIVQPPRQTSLTMFAPLGRSDQGNPDPPPVTSRIAAIVPSGSVGTALIGGWISWADPDLGGDYLATRFPRGTLVRLCTPNRCIVRRSNDFGPSAKIDPPRIADLAVLDWESLCGLPRARGVCRGTVEAIGEIALPPTDAAP